MSIYDEQEDVSSLTRKDTEKNLPWGWVFFFVALIFWGIYYLYAYTPSISGWTQEGAYNQENPAQQPIKPQ